MKSQLTESDVKKIEEEIEYRKLVVRKEALEAVKEARAHGDLSENFEYKAAKQAKNQVPCVSTEPQMLTDSPVQPSSLLQPLRPQLK